MEQPVAVIRREFPDKETASLVARKIYKPVPLTSFPLGKGWISISTKSWKYVLRANPPQHQQYWDKVPQEEQAPFPHQVDQRRQELTLNIGDGTYGDALALAWRQPWGQNSLIFFLPGYKLISSSRLVTPTAVEEYRTSVRCTDTWGVEITYSLKYSGT